MLGQQQNANALEALLYRPRPTAWQQFLRRPRLYLAQRLYTWQQPTTTTTTTATPQQPPPNPSPAADPITVVCVSDTHNSQPALPDGDVLVHAGDLTQTGTREELENAIAWLHAQPHPVKIVVAGNHDKFLDPNCNAAASSGDSHCDGKASGCAALDWDGITYLENEETTVACGRGGRRLRVYGSPWSPQHGNWAFQYPRKNQPGARDVWAGRVPEGVDILVTHGPPKAHLDLLEGLGCEYLLEALWRARPRLHVFGHVHEGAGTTWLRYTPLQRAYERMVTEGGGLWNFACTALCWAYALLFPEAATAGGEVVAGTLLVNAAVVGGLRDDERRRPITVVI